MSKPKDGRASPALSLTRSSVASLTAPSSSTDASPYRSSTVNSDNPADEQLEPYVRKKSASRRVKRTPLEADDSPEHRTKINSRERKRMHDLNKALDSLRQVMPYAQEPSMKKLSKISTLMMARNYIVKLNEALEEARRHVQHSQPATLGLLPGGAMVQPSAVANPMAAAAWSHVLLSGGQAHPYWPFVAPSATNLPQQLMPNTLRF